MAFIAPASGDRINQRAGSILPKRCGSALTAPTVGMLLQADNTANDSVIQCTTVTPGTTDVPAYLLWTPNSPTTPATTSTMLSVIELTKASQLVFEYSGVINRGDKVVFAATPGTIKISGFVRDVVKTDNTNGVGRIRAIDSPATGLCVLEF